MESKRAAPWPPSARSRRPSTRSPLAPMIRSRRPTRMAKILATLGPASDGDGVLRRMLEAGVDVVRLNLSHGSREEHRRRTLQVRRLAAKLGKPVGILVDLPGPKIRTGEMA